MEKPIESRLRSSKSATPPNKNGHSPSPELYDSRNRLTTNKKKPGGHAPITMSKSVSPPKATPPRYLSATNSDAGQPPPLQAPPQMPRVPPTTSSMEKTKLLGHAHLDKDSSYVKFPRRVEPAHEYSYPKLIDAYKDKKKLTPPPPPVPLPLEKNSSSASSSSSKKSRQSLPSLVLSCRGGGGVASDDVGVAEFESSHTSLSPLGAEATTSMTLICAHCRKSYNPAHNSNGACRYAPNDWARSTVERVTCLSCARCLLYHCISDPDEDEEAHPCECSLSGSGLRRWLGLTLLSILVPCLCCYPPLMACYKGAAACRLCGGRHEASKAQLF